MGESTLNSHTEIKAGNSSRDKDGVSLDGSKDEGQITYTAQNHLFDAELRATAAFHCADTCTTDIHADDQNRYSYSNDEEVMGDLTTAIAKELGDLGECGTDANTGEESSTIEGEEHLENYAQAKRFPWKLKGSETADVDETKKTGRRSEVFIENNCYEAFGMHHFQGPESFDSAGSSNGGVDQKVQTAITSDRKDKSGSGLYTMENDTYVTLRNANVTDKEDVIQPRHKWAEDKVGVNNGHIDHTNMQEDVCESMDRASSKRNMRENVNAAVPLFNPQENTSGDPYSGGSCKKGIIQMDIDKGKDMNDGLSSDGGTLKSIKKETGNYQESAQEDVPRGEQKDDDIDDEEVLKEGPNENVNPDTTDIGNRRSSIYIIENEAYEPAFPGHLSQDMPRYQNSTKVSIGDRKSDISIAGNDGHGFSTGRNDTYEDVAVHKTKSGLTDRKVFTTPAADVEHYASVDFSKKVKMGGHRMEENDTYEPAFQRGEKRAPPNGNDIAGNGQVPETDLYASVDLSKKTKYDPGVYIEENGEYETVAVNGEISNHILRRL